MGGGVSKKKGAYKEAVIDAGPVIVLIDPPTLPRDGLTVSALQRFIDEQCGGRTALNGLSTLTVWQQFIHPIARDWDLAYTDILKEEEFDRNDVDVATVFICHCWQNEFLQLCDVLFDHYADSGTYLWIDIFCYNQLLFIPVPRLNVTEDVRQWQQLEDAAEDGGSITNHSVTWWNQVMRPFITNMQQVLVVLMPWHEPLLLQDTRCVWELYCALLVQKQRQEREERRKEKYRLLMQQRSQQQINAMIEAAADDDSSTSDDDAGVCNDSDSANEESKQLGIEFSFTRSDTQSMQQLFTNSKAYVDFLLKQSKQCQSKGCSSTISAQQQKLQSAIETAGGHRRCDKLIAAAMRRCYVHKVRQFSVDVDDAAAKEEMVMELQATYRLRDEELHRQLEQQGVGAGSKDVSTATGLNLKAMLTDSKEDIMHQLRDNKDLLRVAIILCEECILKRKKFTGFLSVATMDICLQCSRLHSELQQFKEAVHLLEDAVKISDRLLRRTAAANSVARIASADSCGDPLSRNHSTSNMPILLPALTKSSSQPQLQQQLSLRSIKMGWQSSKNPSLTSIPRLQSSDSFHLDDMQKQQPTNEVLMIKEELAAAYCRNKQYTKAIQLLKHCSEGWAVLHGVGHERSLGCMMQLAAVYVECKYFEEARVIYSTGVEKASKYQGSNSRFTIDFMHKLALLYIEMESLDKALATMNQCLAKERVVYKAAIDEALARIAQEQPQEPTSRPQPQQLPPEQKETKKGTWGLFSMFTAQKQDEESVVEEESVDPMILAEAEVDIDEKLTLLRLLIDTARLFHRFDNAVMALPLFEEAMQLSLKVHGGSDTLTVELVESLLSLYTELHLIDDLLAMYERYHDSLKRQIGHRHRDTLQCMNNLGYLYMHHKHLEQAEVILSECISLRREELGQSHADTLITMHNLANVYLQLKRYADAYRMFLECLFLRRQRLGLHHEDTEDTRAFLAHICRNVYNREFHELMELKPLASTVTSE